MGNIKLIDQKMYIVVFFSIIGVLGFWLLGYGLGFGESYNGIVGTSFFAAVGLPLDAYPHLFFQAKQYTNMKLLI